KSTVNIFATAGYADEESPAYSFGAEKVIAETTMLVYAASAVGHRPKVADRVHELALLLVPHARSDRVLLDVALHPSLAFKFAVHHILLRKLGYPDTAFDSFLRCCMTSRTRNGHERPPCAAVERKWISCLWIDEDTRVGWKASLRDSVLNWPIDILSGLRD